MPTYPLYNTRHVTRMTLELCYKFWKYVALRSTFLHYTALGPKK